MNIAFVILNYNTSYEVIACINSIVAKIDTYDYTILIVDNHSNDYSVVKLNEFITTKSKIEMICNKENLGFARGNNAGIEYVNKEYNPEFVVVLNSDTELIQNDLYSKLKCEYSKSEFSLLGPMILTANGKCNNSPLQPPTIEDIKKELRLLKFEKKLHYFHLYRLYCGMLLTKKVVFNKVIQKNKDVKKECDFYNYQTSVCLQGCFLVFSNHAFKYINGFNVETFLYYEEALLYLSLKEQNLISVYYPEICIFHREGCSTGKYHKRNKRKLLFINQCLQDSALVLLNYLK